MNVDGVSVGVRLPEALFSHRDGSLDTMVSQLEQSSVSYVSVGDHVSFRDGTGYDGLIRAARLLAVSTRLTVYISVYLLPLRHPVLVARQVSTAVEGSPGRLLLGVGVGGDDRHEVEVCGVDPATRGLRADEALDALRRLLSGQPTTHHGRFFRFDDAIIRPAPPVPVPLIVGGRSPAALRRAGRHGDGWLGVWVSAERFEAATAEVQAHRTEAGRGAANQTNGMVIWCGIGEDRAARSAVAIEMQDLYHRPFDDFARWVPHGSPERIAEFVAPYVSAGCRHVTLIPCAKNSNAAVEGAMGVADLLGQSRAHADADLVGGI